MITDQPSPVSRCQQKMLLLLLLLPVLSSSTASLLTCYLGPDNGTVQCECEEEDLNTTEVPQLQVICYLQWRAVDRVGCIC